MRKWFYLILFSLFLFIPNVFANEINKISMDIFIDDSGNAPYQQKD